ncbi:ABC transporter ATP-binding protein [Leptolyngbya sp. NK1-12]|uniref:ABC transporter ATP-binding protein n=1 Tax=Leptolyngbya sp. NK1-12 TaxID=2547451 RepID=A0AA96WL53_9CYAN|nr:ABC transporter ATP-binding protein [Leptolyngbya sp. NK1-12]WNZ27294.1 ABC transporter ATP-binding protein [Leptolyngbya sp. NK1-12]
MSHPVVCVEGLGKKYIIGHQQKERYTTLRDTLSNVGKKLLRGFGNSKFRSENPTQEEFWALRDVSFEIKQGDRVGIIGRNGAGKSTLLKILSRITEPTKGRIRIQGRVASLLEVGTGFHPELTGRENIFLNGAILGMSKAEIKRKFDEIVAFAEIEKFLDTPVKRYSSGMYVRLAFAVAAHLEPEILIVDEVLAVGDAQFQKKCLGKMDQVANEGRTVIFVSHSMGTISTLCNKALYLARGHVIDTGSADQVIKKYFSDTLQNQTEDLNELRLPGYGKQVKFVDIRLESKETNLEFGQPIRYELTVESDHNIDGLSIGSSIFSTNGNCIGSLITEEFSIRASQRLVLQLIIPNSNLAPGAYYSGFSVGFGHKKGYRQDLDIVIGRPCFEIRPTPNAQFQIANWHSNWGSIVFNDIHLLKKQVDTNNQNLISR